MISNSSVAPVIHALVEELARQGLDGLSELISRLFKARQAREKKKKTRAWEKKISDFTEKLLLNHLDRWQIEYNHRHEKSILGVGQAQVWNENSVEKQPALHVAAYSDLLWANQIAHGDKEHEDFGIRPSWRRKPKRNTCRALIGVLRATLLEHPDELEEMGITIPIISVILRQVT